MNRDSRLKYFLNSKFFITLITLILTALLIFVVSKISFIFRPLRVFLQVVSLPLIISLILYYLFMPVMKFLTKKGATRNQAILVVFLIIIVVILILILWMAPLIWDQLVSLFSEFPKYYETISNEIAAFFNSESYFQFQSYIDQALESVASSIKDFSTDFISNSVSKIGSTFGTLFNLGLALITAPIMFYYLLKEDHKIMPFITRLVPTKSRDTIRHIGSDLNSQLSLYIRGQLIVALAVSIMFTIGYTLIGLPYAVALGVISGFLNIIPYLGSMLALIPALIIAIVHSPFMIVKVLIVAFIEQTLEGRIISPKVLGDNLNIHPIVILLVLLTAGQLYGVTGVIIGVPVFACLKVLVKYGFAYFKEKTDLYPEHEELDDIIREEKSVN